MNVESARPPFGFDADERSSVTLIAGSRVGPQAGPHCRNAGSTWRDYRFERISSREVRVMFGPSQRETQDHFNGVLLGKNPNATMRALVNGIDASDGLIGAVGNFVMEPWLGSFMEQWVFGLTPKGMAFVPIGRMGTAKPRHPDTRFLSFSLVTAFRYFAPHADNDPSEHLEFEVRLPPHGPGYRFQMYVPDFPLSRVLLRAMVAELPERHGLPPVETVGRPQPTTAQASTAGESRDTQAVPKPATAPPRAQRTSRLGIRRPR